MFLYMFTKPNQGALCKVISATNPEYNNQIMTFKDIEHFYQLPVYVFETCHKEKVIVTRDDAFEILPYKGSLLYLLDLALQTNDKEWFMELIFKWNHESE